MYWRCLWLPPVRLINEYEFRTLTEHEIECACHAITLMGRAMGITDLPISYAEYEKIVDDEYAGDKMRVDPRGKAIANSVLAMFLRPAPAFIHPFARRIVYALLDDPVRRALDYPKQPRMLRHFAKALLLDARIHHQVDVPDAPVELGYITHTESTRRCPTVPEIS